MSSEVRRLWAAASKTVVASLILAGVLVAAAGSADGTAAPVLVLAICVALIIVAAARILPHSDARLLMSMVLAAFALRAAVGAVLVLRSLALGNGGFTTGDDIWYASAAGHLVRYLQGRPELPFVPPYWNGEYYLMTTYVYAEAAVFWAFGQHVLNMIVVNAFLGALAVLLIADVSARIFGRAAGVTAAAVTAIYPSTVLWSSVNLRDTMVMFLVAATLWCLERLHARPSVAWIVVAFLPAWAEYGLRFYIEAVLLGVVLLSVVAMFIAAGPARRWRWPITAVVVFTFVLINSGLTTFVSQPLLTLGNIAEVRVSNQFGRTAFDTPSPTPTATATSPRPSGSFGPSPAAPTPTIHVNPLPYDVDADVAVSRSVTHLPVGLVYSLFAPFPWASETASDLAAVPDMLVWYLVLGCATVTLWTQRRRWSRLAPEALFLGAFVLLLSLGEGNVGTLFRHRAMAVPAAVILASPTLVAIAGRVRRARSAP